MTKIEQIQKIVFEKFGINIAIAVHGALTTTNPESLTNTHGTTGRDGLKELRDEYDAKYKK